jgi:fluoroacetyl-CoA thioesterase
MKSHLKRGLKVELPVVVSSWMKPKLEGLVRHPLYATWAMVYHMETASRMLLAPYLEDKEEAVGGGVLVKHLHPVGMNAHIRIVATLVRVSGKKIYTRLEVIHKNRKIGEGSTVQVVMSRSRFAKILRETRQRGKHGHG